MIITSVQSIRTIQGIVIVCLCAATAAGPTKANFESQPPPPEHVIRNWSGAIEMASVESQPPPPLATLLRAVAWWQAEGHGRLPTRLIVHLPTFIPLYLSYAAIDDPKSVVPFEAWLLLNGVGDPGLRDCLVELFRLAKLCR
mgnify:CR=1 FL=1